MIKLLEILIILLKHFQYSIKDIRSYNELTTKEKEIISLEMFEYLRKLC
jgi:hypothetical protein